MIGFSTQNLFYYFVFFISAFFGIFGFKLFGIVDLMVVIPFVVLMFLVASGSEIKIPFSFLIFSLFFFIILVFQFLVFNLEPNIHNPHFIARLLRGTLSGIFLFSIFYYLISKGYVFADVSFNIFSLVFLICALSVYAQAFFPSIQPFFGEIWGFDKESRYLRAFGLSAGYDTTGYLLGWFSAVTLFVWFNFRKTHYILIFVVLSFSVFFTSRTSMALYLGLVFLTSLLSLKRLKLFSLSSISLFLLLSSLVYFLIFPVIYYSVLSSEGSRLVMGVDIASRFAATNVELAVSQHFALPESPYSIFFGTGLDPHLDPGYTQAIHHGGVASLILYILFYVFIVLFVLKSTAFVKKGAKYDLEFRWTSVWRYSVFLMLIVMIIGNFKNLYFFTRGYHEIFLIISAITLGSSSWMRARSRNPV